MILTPNEQLKLTDKLMSEVRDLFNEYFIKMGMVALPTIEVKTEIDRTRIGLRELVAVVNSRIDRKLYPSGLTTRSRRRDLVMRRQVTAHIGRQLGYALSLVGRVINVDHATVIHSCKLVDNLLEKKDLEMIKVYDEIYSTVNNYHKEHYGKDLSEVKSQWIKS